MTTPKSHTLATVCRMLGGEVTTSRVFIPPCWEAVLRTCGKVFCAGPALICAEGPTKRAAIAALETKLRACAMAVLSDEFEFEAE